MAKREQLAEFDDMVKQIVAFCEKEGICGEKLSGFVDRIDEKGSWRSKKLVVGVLLAVFVVWLLFQVPPVGRCFEAVARIAAIQVLPFYDWTWLYRSRCLLENPDVQTGPRIGPSDCLVCEDFSAIPYLINGSARDVSEILSSDLPVLVSTDEEPWPTNFDEEVTMDAILDAYERLASEFRGGPVVCNLLSNLRSKDGYELVKKLQKRERSRWFAHWENCDGPEIKLLRSFYARPSFLPLSLDLTDTNWVFLSSGYATRIPKKVDFLSPAFVLMQVKGRINVFLNPHENCSKVCEPLEFTILEKETLIVPGTMWKLSYATDPDEEETISFGIGAFWDLN